MKRIIEFFVRYPIWTNAFIILLVVLGFTSYNNIKKSFFPERRVKEISIQVAYPGASPQEMEEGVTIKIEEALKGIAGIEEVTSTSSENTSIVKVNTLKSYDIDEVLSDVKNAVDQINSFPDNAEKAKVFKRKPLDYCMFLTLYGNQDLMSLKRISDQIENDLLQSGVISQIVITGIPEPEISIELTEATLQRYGITFDEIALAVRRNNLDISGGTLKSSVEELIIRSRERSTDINKIGNIPIRSNENGSVIRISDVATVKEQFAETVNKSLYNNKNSVNINIFKLPEEDILEITDYLYEYIDAFNLQNEDVKLNVIRDQSVELKQRIKLLFNNGITGLILVLVSLSLFLNIRLSFWVAVGIPFSILGMFIIASLVGITINQISLFGMILVIGILVDDGIVISENIYSRIEKGETPFKAVVNGTIEVFPAVVTSVMTTIVVFSAFFFLDGNIGETIGEMAVVVIACLAVSLVEAAIILPSHLNSPTIVSSSNAFRTRFNKGLDFVRVRLYGRYLDFAIKWRWIMTMIPVLFIMTIMGMMKGNIIKTSFFPFIDTNYLTVELVLKPGTREIETEKYLLDIERKVWEVNKLLSAERGDSLSVVTSSRVTIGTSESATGGHAGTVELLLLEGEIRKLESFKIAQKLREHIGTIDAAEKFSVGARTFFGKPVSLRLLSKNQTELDLARDELKAKLNEFSALKDVIDNNEPGKREVNITLKEKAYALGLDYEEVTKQIRQGFFGQEIQRLIRGTDELKVWVRYTPEERERSEQLEQVRIKLPNGKMIPLNEIADFEIKRGIVSILHYNGAKEVMIEAELANQNEAVGPIIDELETVILPQLLKKYPSVRKGTGGQVREQEKLMISAKSVVPIVLITIYLMIALTFRSFSQPIIVILMIFPGIAGAIFGHYIENTNVVIMSYLGSIALIGVVINDAVVFLDKYNQNIKEGFNVKTAVKQAGISRFRAILLTSITTVAGLYPLIYEKSIQAQFLIPMAITVAYGIGIGTIIILGFFPSLIVVLNDIRVFLQTLWKWEVPSREEIEPAQIENERLKLHNQSEKEHEEI